MLQYESKLSILTGFIQSKYPEEFADYVQNIEKQSKETVQEETGAVQDAEIIEEQIEENKEIDNE